MGLLQMGKFFIDGREFNAPKLNAGLYIVATPIGNLRDISIRALETLAAVDLIICEDSRTSAKLLNHYGIKTKKLSFHEHNEKEKTKYIIKRLKEGETIALISDAGTPLISDPGFPLVQQARDEGLDIFAIAGPSALIAALSVSGLPSDNFSFFGFLPAKSVAREKYMQKLKNNQETLIFYESPHRLAAFLDSAQNIFGSTRKAAIIFEISKQYERIMRNSLSNLNEQLKNKQIKGEAVILISGAKKINIDENIWQEELANLLKNNSLKSSVENITAKYNLKRKQVYDAALKIREKKI